MVLRVRCRMRVRILGISYYCARICMLAPRTILDFAHFTYRVVGRFQFMYCSYNVQSSYTFDRDNPRAWTPAGLGLRLFGCKDGGRRCYLAENISQRLSHRLN